MLTVVTRQERSRKTREPKEESPREGKGLFSRWAKTVKDLSGPTKAPAVYTITTDT
jgi:hypothetical protein